MVMPQDLVVNYFTTDMDSAERVTHTFTLSKMKCAKTTWVVFFREPQKSSPIPIGPLEAAKNKAQHTEPPQESNIYFLGEQSCWLDLDNDGYKEPYAVTFDQTTGHVYRIIARYYEDDIKYVEAGKNRGKVWKIVPENYYTKFGFIPSLTAGFTILGLESCLARSTNL